MVPSAPGPAPHEITQSTPAPAEKSVNLELVLTGQQHSRRCFLDLMNSPDNRWLEMRGRSLDVP